MLKCLYHLLGNGTLSLDLIVALLEQIHTKICLKGTCIYSGVIHTTIVVQGEEGEERSAPSEEDHTGLANSLILKHFLDGVLLKQVKGLPVETLQNTKVSAVQYTPWFLSGVSSMVNQGGRPFVI